MTLTEMAQLVAKVQLGDNRIVDEGVIVYWFDTIGDLEYLAAVDALRRFRRERPGVYLEPGHLVELAGADEDDPARSDWIDVDELRRGEARAITTGTDDDWRDEVWPA